MKKNHKNNGIEKRCDSFINYLHIETVKNYKAINYLELLFDSLTSITLSDNLYDKKPNILFIFFLSLILV